MRADQAHRGIKLTSFWLRVCCFLVLTALALSYAVFVLTPKHDYGICSMMNLYRQPEDSVDVLLVGTSMLYAGVNTNVLWREYGITAYNLCSAEQPFWISYYMLREALKTQRPRLIVLDAKAAIYPNDYPTMGRTILSTYGIQSLENRMGAIRSCTETLREALDFFLAFPKVHSNYAGLEANDFLFPPDNGGRGSSWKGYIEQDEIEAHEKPSLVFNNVKRNMNAREEEYARKIFELAQSEGIPLMLVGMPNPDYANDHMYYNALWAVAAEYGFSGTNYNDPNLSPRLRLYYSTDFADWQHLNVKGSISFSTRLGKDLQQAYDLPDHRGDAFYASYDACADRWFALLDTFQSSGLTDE